MRKISIFNTVLFDLIIYWLVTSYKLLGTDHCITDGGERGGFGIHYCRGKNCISKFVEKY